MPYSQENSQIKVPHYRFETKQMTLTGLTLPYFCACTKPRHGFLMPYVMVFF
jgi:hypothetical protein